MKIQKKRDLPLPNLQYVMAPWLGLIWYVLYLHSSAALLLSTVTDDRDLTTIRRILTVNALRRHSVRSSPPCTERHPESRRTNHQ